MTVSMRVRLLALFIVLVAVFAAAQLDSARIQGTITDASGASVVAAPVVITNVNTGRIVNTQSDEAGFYSMTGLQPGRYRIEVKQGNFKTYTQEFTLQVGQIAPLNVVLQPGQVTETVEVTSDIPLVESASSNISEVIVGRQVTELPLNGRNFTQLATLVPGVTRGAPGNQATGAGNQAETFRYSESGGGALVVNGLRPQANNYLLDGIDNNESLVNTLIFFPPAEAIQEFRVDTSVAPAEYGRAGGGVINSSIKSGTNAWHGSAFWFLRNDNLDARQYFNRIPRDASGNEIEPNCDSFPKPAGCKPEFKRNQFGGTIGGPIFRDRLFFFADYQGLRQQRPTGTEYATVPTLLMREGDFSELSQAIIDPLTGKAFAGNVIPQNRWNAAGMNYLRAFPLPNCAAGQGCGAITQNYIAERLQRQTFNDFDARLDFNISTSSNLFARFSYGQDESTTTSRLETLPAGFGSGFQFHRPRSLAVGHTQVFSPTLINEFRFGFVRTRMGYRPPFQERAIMTELGIPGGNPSELLGGGALIGGWNGQLEYTGDFGPYIVPQDTYQFSDSMSWTRGTHNVKFGANVLKRHVDLFRPNRGKGYFYLAGNGGALGGGEGQYAGFTGYEVSDVLTGFFARYDFGPEYGVVNTRNWETGFFVQDDWKATRRLTLNLGLRYDYYTWPYEKENRQANFDTSTGELVVATEQNRSFIQTDKNNVAPRVGFAYDVLGTGRTVLRGGYGLFYFLDRGGIDNQLAQNPPFSGYSSFDARDGNRITLSGVAPVNSNDATLATGPLPGYSVDLTDPTNVTVFAALPTNRNSYVQQWNLQVQQAITTNTAVNIGYVGTKGTKLTTYFDMNRPAYFSGERVFESVGGAVNVQANNGSSIYHGLQTQLERRLTNGVQFLASYTWSHAIDDHSGAFDNAGNTVDFRNLWLERGNSNQDVRHRFVFSSLIELPWGKGRRYMTDMPSLMEAVLGGWQVNPILTFQSGSPFDVNNRYTRPNLKSGAVAVNPSFDPSKGEDNYLIANAFDTAVGQTQGWGNVGRNQFYGPGVQNVDLSLFKNFAVTERVNVQFRSEFFNLFNTPQFNNPEGNFGDGRFGRVTTVRPFTERQVQFALRATF